LPDILQIDDLSLRDHLVAQHAPRRGWREEFSLDASNVFVFGNRSRKHDPSLFNLPVALLKAGRGWARTGPCRPACRARQGTAWPRVASWP